MSGPQIDTIFAPATAPGRAGVAVFRVSGPGAGAALAALTGQDIPPARRATRARFCDPASGDEIDDGLCLWFPGPASFTGEDVVELHMHGGRAVAAALIDALAALPGLRIAAPGEFTRRAFDHGKLDLDQAEGLADLIDAETEAQRRQARRQMAGVLGQLFEDWRGRLLRALAHLEAEMEFAEEDLPEGIGMAANHSILGVKEDIYQYLVGQGAGERLRDGVYIAILGPPNAGKSSLLNAIARRDIAIVSESAGTTRDVIEAHLDLGGYPVILADTAGLRDAVDQVESEGVRRALERAKSADLKLVLCDAQCWPHLDGATAGLIDDDTIPVVTKIDQHAVNDPVINGMRAAAVSSLTGEGVPALLSRLEAEVASRLASTGAPALTRARHRQALEDCIEALGRSVNAALPELAAEDVRQAANALGRVTGRVGIEDMLDIVFRDFCIGK